MERRYLDDGRSPFNIDKHKLTLNSLMVSPQTPGQFYANRPMYQYMDTEQVMLYLYMHVHHIVHGHIIV